VAAFFGTYCRVLAGCLHQGVGREGGRNVRPKAERKEARQFTLSLCVAPDRSTPDLERTAQRFLSFSSSPSASRGKLSLRDLLEVYTAALTLGKSVERMARGVGGGGWMGGDGGVGKCGDMGSVCMLTVSLLSSLPYITGRLSQTLSSSVPEGASPALDAALRAPLAKVVGGLARFQALVEEVYLWLGERRGRGKGGKEMYI